MMKTNEASLRLAVKVRKYWKQNPETSYREIAEHFDISYHVARRIILGQILTGSFNYPKDGNYAEYRRHGHLFIIYDDGRVWSTTSGRFLNNWNKKGYKIISMNKPGGGQENLLVSRIMLTLFNRPPKEGEFARHLDDDTSNNSLSNLAWGSPRDNVHDSVRNGTYARGETGGRVKLNDKIVLKLIREFDGNRSFLDSFIEDNNLDVVPMALDHILRGKNWTHLTGLSLKKGSIYSGKPMDVKAVRCMHTSWAKSNLTQPEFCEKFVRYLERKGYTRVTKNSVLKALRGKTFSKVYNELSGT
jgi:hypothetical protein